MPLLTHSERLGTALTSTSTGATYRLQEVIGAGGMGIVFASEREHDAVSVAVKMPRLELTADDSRHARIVSEGRLQRRLDHPNIAALLDAGDTPDGLPFLVFERLRGRSLSRAVKDDGPMTPEASLVTLLPVAGAIAVAHRQGIVHRDLSPGNIFLHASASGGPPVPKLLDFGLARGQDDPSLTRTGRAMGTPDYMAPERLQADHPQDESTDLWALSAVMHFCLTGRPPNNADRATLRAVLPATPALSATLARGLRAGPQQRYRNIEEWSRAMVNAAVQDGVRLPQAPDPLGLPAYADWVAAAHDDATASQAVEIPVGARKARTPRLRSAALTGLALAAFGLAYLRPAATAPDREHGASPPHARSLETSPDSPETPRERQVAQQSPQQALTRSAAAGLTPSSPTNTTSPLPDAVTNKRSIPLHPRKKKSTDSGKHPTPVSPADPDAPSLAASEAPPPELNPRFGAVPALRTRW